MDKEFNLLDEPWIKVMKSDCSQEMVSLKDLFIHAHEYEELSGETPTQDIAVFRMLLAVVHAVFYKYDEYGEESFIEDEDTAYERWKNLWELKSFPEDVISDYLEKYREKFWLFHPEMPFYQVPEAHIGTSGTAAKLNGEISESKNKIRFFATRFGDEKCRIDFSEAARWLLHLNGFDDTSAKPKGKNLPSVGAGWLGKLGLIKVKGDNLFETLLLNLVLVNEEHEIWENARPIWELDGIRRSERVEIPMPKDQAALLSMQSRRILLDRGEREVTGYSLLGGDFFRKENAFSEQMTMWKESKEKGKNIGFQPKRHNPERKMWRDFSTMTVDSEQTHIPGVVSWIMELQKQGCLDKRQLINYHIISTQYGDKDFFVTDIFEDSLTLHLSLFTEVGRKWRKYITREVEICEEIAKQVYFLEKNIKRALGDSEGEGSQAKEHFFYNIDIPFRKWLYTLDPEQKDEAYDELRRKWREEEEKIALALGAEMVENAGTVAYIGRFVKEENRLYSSVEAYNLFMMNVKKILENI